MQTKILFCGCQHEYQDKKYGKNQRVHIRGDKSKTYHCSVCNKEKQSGDNKK